MFILRYISASFIFLFFYFTSYGQETIQIDANTGKEYVSPLIEGISGSMNSGWFHQAPKPVFKGFEIEFGIVGMGTFLNDEQRTFSSYSNVKFPESTIDKMVEGVDSRYREMVKDSLMQTSFLVNISGPTAIGSSTENVQLNYAGDTIIVNYQGQQRTVIIPGVNIDSKVSGINMPVTPLGTFQLSLGTLAGTKLSLRFTPPINLGSEIGSVTNYGIGIQHNAMVWFTSKPVIDVSLAFFMQKLSVGDRFKSTSLQYGIFASKTFGKSSVSITPFMGISLEENRSSVRYTYDYTDNYGNAGKMNFAIDMNPGPSFRFRTGGTLKLSSVNFNLTYGYSNHHSLSAGFGFIF
jgi:hypothetical protein